jgi:hypothetical protein
MVGSNDNVTGVVPSFLRFSVIWMVLGEVVVEVVDMWATRSLRRVVHISTTYLLREQESGQGQVG